MSFVNKLNKIADRFERKIIRLAEDLPAPTGGEITDTGLISSMVNPIANEVILQFQSLMDSEIAPLANLALQQASDQGATSFSGKIILGGVLAPGVGWTFSATKNKGKWNVVVHEVASEISGIFAKNSKLVDAFKKFIKKYKAALSARIASEFDNKSGVTDNKPNNMLFYNGDKITNFDASFTNTASIVSN